MDQGVFGNRRRSRSPIRRRPGPPKYPLWTSQTRKREVQKERQEEQELRPLLSAPTCAAPVAQARGFAVFGPQMRRRPRSRSPLLARKPVPENVPPKADAPKKKAAATVQHVTNTTSGSSSGPEPLSSPSTQSRAASSLSSDSVADLFPFDSEIFDTANAKKEPIDEPQMKNAGVVALRNPNIVAICQPPRMITGMHPRIAPGIPDMRGSFGADIQPKPNPSTLEELVTKLKKMTGMEAVPQTTKSQEKDQKPTSLQTTPHPLKTADIIPKPPVRPRSRARARAIRRRHAAKLAASKDVSHPPQEVANANTTECSPFVVAARNMKFCCQLAHGSPTAIISNFATIDELFKSIAESYNISPDDIIFCTINTFKKDMDKLFSGSLEYTDMLFAHVKGQAVEVELTKSEGVFGLTVSDNGRCRSFIKRIRDNSIASRARPALDIGQLIEKIDGINVTGMRHYEVVRILRNMPIGKTFTMRVVSPKESGFQLIAPRNSLARKRLMCNGQRTLRFKVDGNVVIEEGTLDREMIKRLNEVLDSYLGVQDDQMAQALWDLALTCETLPELTKAVRESELSVFGFPDDLILDIWGILSDWRRELKKKNEKEEKEKQKVNILEDEEEQPLLPLI